MFEIVSLDVTAGADVAFAYALLRCGSPEELAERPIAAAADGGAAQEGGRWTVTHEHHSFPDG